MLGLDTKPKGNECGKNHWGQCLGHVRASFQLSLFNLFL